MIVFRFVEGAIPLPAKSPKSAPKKPTARKAAAGLTKTAERKAKRAAKAAKTPEMAAEAIKAPAPAQAKKKKEYAALLKAVLTQLEDDKAEDIVTIDLEGRADYADVIVIASGRSARHVAATADHLADRVKADGFGRAVV